MVEVTLPCDRGATASLGVSLTSSSTLQTKAPFWEGNAQNLSSGERQKLATSSPSHLHLEPWGPGVSPS